MFHDRTRMRWLLMQDAPATALESGSRPVALVLVHNSSEGCWSWPKIYKKPNVSEH